ncbi:alpha/beta hydrolase [Myxococcota bacterium]|nr:alpha/beta hydrolase [Myxococcota bacterium]
MLLLALFTLACVPVEVPPDAWPQSGCVAPTPFSAQGRADRSREYWLQVEPDLQVRVHARWPRRDDCFAAAVLVPPGFEWGLRLMETPHAELLLDHGVAVVSWDPRGRGFSDGEEVVNGHESQDDLAALLRWVASQERVDPTAVVVSSRSFGGALAAGALGRHEDLAVAGWTDVESPGYLSEDLAYTADSSQERVGSYVPEDPDEALAWWAEREPAQLIAGVTAPYHRFQGLPDHALGERTAAAAAMLNAADQAAVLRYNMADLDPRDATAAYIREHAIDGGIDPDDSVVGDAVLWWLGVEPGQYAWD